MQLRVRHLALLVNLFVAIVGEVPASLLSYVTIYEDAACSSNPTKLTFTEDPDCTSQTSPTCVVGSSMYSQQGCSTLSGYNEVLQSVFSSSLFLAVETFSDAGSCSVLSGVVAYIADNLCHVAEDGVSSFKVSTLDDMAATLAMFNNIKCSGYSTSQIDWNVAQLTATSCGQGADQIASIGGATNKWSILTFFTDSECASKPINVQVYRRFTCEAEQYPASAACSFCDENLYSTWSCADDYVAFTENAFGAAVPFLVEEWYYDQVSCTELEHLMIFPADGSCIALGSPSLTVKLQPGGNVTMDTFISLACSGASETRSMDRVSLAATTCPIDSNIKYHVGGVTPQWKVIAAYEDTDCSNIPVNLTITSEFICEPLTSQANEGCVATNERASWKVTVLAIIWLSLRQRLVIIIHTWYR